VPGQDIAILRGTKPGGSYDLYGRVIGEHLSRYIPGNPTIIVEHMPGAEASSHSPRRLGSGGPPF
jgi:hypothetical protein